MSRCAARDRHRSTSQRGCRRDVQSGQRDELVREDRDGTGDIPGVRTVRCGVDSGARSNLMEQPDLNRRPPGAIELPATDAPAKRRETMGLTIPCRVADDNWPSHQGANPKLGETTLLPLARVRSRRRSYDSRYPLHHERRVATKESMPRHDLRRCTARRRPLFARRLHSQCAMWYCARASFAGARGAARPSGEGRQEPRRSRMETLWKTRGNGAHTVRAFQALKAAPTSQISCHRLRPVAPKVAW